MALATGTRIGPHEVIGLLGSGGMGEVYRAHDSDLNRDVALKVLPDAVNNDPERLARFRREAQVLASLNHPNIAAIHGLEASGDGGRHIVLVLELVEGPTLADRLAAGALPLDEALGIARQLADALEAAHERGVVHRDLKPANIKLKGGGPSPSLAAADVGDYTVKVLDFGLAKALEPDASSAATDITNSPTLTAQGTALGVILGTAAYMAPEQARGKRVDKRADVWAFGVILFEALTGQRLFASGEVSDTLALVLTKQPDWASLPSSTPAAIRRLLKRCLEKDRSKRLADIADARLEIDDALSAPAQVLSTPGEVAAPARWRRWAPWAVAAGGAAAAFTTLMLWAPWRSSPVETPVRMRADVGTAEPMVTGAMAFAPDGSMVTFVARPARDSTIRSMLHIRRLDRLDAEVLADTDGATTPFFSTDGRWIAFFADGSLKMVPATGGGVIVVCEAPAARGGWWGDGDTIIFATREALMRVSSAGGQAERLTTLAPGEAPPMFPQLLPGGRALLYAEFSFGAGGDAPIVVRQLPDGPPKSLQVTGRLPRYVESGHLTFVRNGTLFATPFDLAALERRGEVVPVVDGIQEVPNSAAVSISRNGRLVYQPGSGLGPRSAPVMWLDRSRALGTLRATAATWAFPRFSPDGRRLAMTIFDGRQGDIWTYDWERGILTRVTSNPANDLSPVWTPDGTGLVFGSSRSGAVNNNSNLYWQRADGTGEARRLTEHTTSQLPDDFHPNGRELVFHQGDPSTTTRGSLEVLPLERDASGAWKAGSPTTFAGGPFLKANARISPDGRWLAYSANESGRFEIYVQPFSGPGARVQVSSDGGNLPLWSRAKRELYYAGPAHDQQMMVVSYVTAGDGFVPSRPAPWSAVRFSAAPPNSTYGPGLDVHPSGDRFAVAPLAVAATEGAARPGQLVFVFNLFDELRRLAPVR